MTGGSCLQHHTRVTTCSMTATKTLAPGAIARLVASYLALRGVSQRRLARSVDTDVQRIAHLLRGSDYKGVRTLGIISRGDTEPLLVSVARALQIPTPELAAAIAEDVGLPEAWATDESSGKGL